METQTLTPVDVEQEEGGGDKEQTNLPEVVLEQFKEMYFFEIQRREEIEKRSQSPISILAGMIGGFFYLTIQALQHWNQGVVFIFFAISGYFLTRSLYCFAKYMQPKDYMYLNYPIDLFKEYHMFLDKHPDAPPDYIDYLTEHYAKCATYNRKANRDRSYWYAEGWRYLFYALAAEGIFAFLYILLSFDFWTVILTVRR